MNLEEKGAVRVLIADDEAAHRELAGEAFESASLSNGLRVDLVQAESGPEMVRYVTGGGISLVVSDVMMPGGDGPESVKQFVDGLDAPKVVFVTGWTSIENRFALDGMKEHPNVLGVFPKPLRAEKVAELLEIVAGRRQVREELRRVVTPAGIEPAS